jgi:hypothetical protein
MSGGPEAPENSRGNTTWTATVGVTCEVKIYFFMLLMWEYVELHP